MKLNIREYCVSLHAPINIKAQVINLLKDLGEPVYCYTEYATRTVKVDKVVLSSLSYDGIDWCVHNNTKPKLSAEEFLLIFNPTPLNFKL